MQKQLQDMSLEELWQLFPITLVEHQECWANWFEEERASLAAVMPAGARISHIGSTAIAGIWAKPIVDILIELPAGAGADDFSRAKEALITAGYICMSQSATRASFNKGYTLQGYAERVFHVHLRFWGDHDEVYFCRYLNEHPAAAQEYQDLKLGLWQKYEHDRDAYTAAKTGFIQRITDLAKASETAED